MDTNPLFLDKLSKFFRHSGEGWLYTLMLLELGLKDVQYYTLLDGPSKEAISLCFSGCESVKISVSRRGNEYMVCSFPFDHHVSIPSFSPDRDPLSAFTGRIKKFVEWRRACPIK